MPRSVVNRKSKSFTADLGRATLRGVRKCPKCGTYNGTRGLICKNKSCDAVFKESAEKRKSTEACQLVTANSTKIYSVRVRDRGPDYRGFVQLPLMGNSKLQAVNQPNNNPALCFVDSCQRQFNSSILKCHEEEQNTLPGGICSHIKATHSCVTKATPLAIKAEAINSLNCSDDIKKNIWACRAKCATSLVQRVSKNVLAVKCDVSSKHPLGYLHFLFTATKTKDRNEFKYFCSCLDFKGNSKGTECSQDKKCFHYFACIAAFASDEKLTEEFFSYIKAELSSGIPSSTMADSIDFDDDDQLVSSILNEELVGTNEPCDIEVKVLADRRLYSNVSVIDPDVQVQDLEINSKGKITIIHGINENMELNDLADTLTNMAETLDVGSALELVPLKECETQSVSRKSNKIGKQLKKVNQAASAPKVSTKHPQTPPVKQDVTTPEERATNVQFIDWLSSVTEKINQTMHFQFSGKPEPLIFHVPEIFFDCLRDRMSCGATKKRLPNYTHAFIRKDAIPIGTFTKYSWHLTNVLHVKRIFETPLIPLEITKSFSLNKDGTYEPYVESNDDSAGEKKPGLVPIKPLEFKTYLKVGTMSFDQVEPIPFIIEWIPDILPLTKIGEMRIRFEYGHQRGSCVDRSFSEKK